MLVKRLTCVLSTALLLIPLRAQSTFGAIIGVVQDQSASLIPDVTIALKNLDDNTTHSVVSSPDGSFQLLNLRPGNYQLTASKSGFNASKTSALTLEARQQLRVDFTLDVAAVTQNVEVVDSVAIVNTENGTIGDTKKFNQVVQLPMNYRGGSDSPLSALVAVPGVQQDSGGNMSIGGGTPSQIQFSVDGTSTVNIRQNGALGNMNPSSELISELKVTQFNNNAEFSQLADVTIITKSGTQRLSRQRASNISRTARSTATTWGFDSKAHKAYNTFGGSFSGPVNIPHLYNGKDQTFFFADYEGNRRRFTTPQVLSVPTAAMRAGDLTNLPGGAVIDPSTGAPFPGNQIPLTSLNPVAQSLSEPLSSAAQFRERRGYHRQLSPADIDARPISTATISASIKI